jgi:hypothetical protein
MSLLGTVKGVVTRVLKGEPIAEGDEDIQTIKEMIRVRRDPSSSLDHLSDAERDYPEQRNMIEFNKLRTILEAKQGGSRRRRSTRRRRKSTRVARTSHLLRGSR